MGKLARGSGTWALSNASQVESLIELRARMVHELQRQHRLSDPRVAAAMRAVPRHVFVPHVEAATAYSDQAIPTHWLNGLPTSSASQPAIVAAMLELLDPLQGASILEIGSGTGYNAALLAELVGPSGRVVSVEIQPEVASEAAAHLVAVGLENVEVVCADGFEGHAARRPYDRIIVTAGASDLAPAWVDQLARGGRLVLPLSIRGVQQCVAFIKEDEGSLRSAAACEGGFMPLQGDMANSDTRHDLPGHPGAFLGCAPDVEVDIEMVGRALLRPGPLTSLGVEADFRQVFGSLRRWFAYHEHRVVTLTYIGQSDDPAVTSVPRLLDFAMPNAMQWLTVGVLDDMGLAALERAGLPADGDGPDAVIPLAVRPFGRCEEAARIVGDLVESWDVAGRPGTSELRIAAYMASASPPAPADSTYNAGHATFVVSL